jgi:hypothetical protein
MAEFDKASRYLAKQDPPGFFAWLWRYAVTPLLFHSWLAARRLALPVEEDRTCDNVAAFRLPDRPEPTHVLIVDFKAQAQSGALNQLLDYVVRLQTEPPPEGTVLPPLVGGAVINLTGAPQPASLDVHFPGISECDWHFGILQRTLREESAAATLADITAGRTTRWLLPWIPLMHEGGEAAIMEGWKQAAEAEPDEQVRATLAGLALVFAELADRIDVWKHALEGWNVRKSQVVEEWREEGRAEGREEGRVEALQEIILTLLRKRFSIVPAPLVQRIEASTDIARLQTALEQILDIRSPEQLQF